MIKKLIWLIKHQEEIAKIIKNPKKKEENYSTAGVPEYQKDYVEELLKRGNE